MAINYEITTIYIKPNNIEDNTFIHFDSKYHLDLFINMNKNLSFGHKCCSDKGIKVNYISHEEINSLKKIFFEYINNKKNISEKNKGECSICYDTKYLKKTVCNHSFCDECFQSWYNIKKECPMCRAPL